MTIDEAIKALTFWESLFKDYHDSRLRSALQLGIEALKFRRSEKEAGYLDSDDLLPGETED